ncbi:AAA domain-containing protein [Hamadaea sp. NPDC051192]|uniref:AAA domain-containing protein n=1 Tax=Hamadaea sp. NPDC051192 TaxID=3154940 RepID=UPI003414B1CA
MFHEPALHLAAFDALDQRLGRNGLTRDRVERELAEGVFDAWEINDGSSDRRRFKLPTRRLEVALHSERSYSGPWTLTVLDNATPRRDAPAPSDLPVIPGRVTLYYPADAPSCDLKPLIEEVRSRRWAAEAERTLTRVRLSPRMQAQLRDDVRRRFGSLRALMELDKQRAAKGDRALTEGSVVDGAEVYGPTHPYAGELVVRLDTSAPFQIGDDLCRLAVWPVGEPKSSAILDAIEIVDEVVVLGLPRSGESERLTRWARPGKRVTVSETGQFRFRRHLIALYNFLDEKTTGNWTALATLLCDPAQLAHTHRPDERWDARRALNVRQRRAVAGALDARHAYVVQGPPGTGKTQVIAEIAGRLVERGERVLLTAPTHVALDEVLQRVTDDDGVLPLRLSWNDKFVAEEVRRFTLSGYDATIAANLRIPSTSKMEQWRRRLGELGAQRGAVDEWQMSLIELRRAENESQARSEYAVRRVTEFHATMAAIHADLEGLRQRIVHLGHDLQRLREDESAISVRLTELQPTRGWFGRLLDSAGIGVVARLTAKAARTRQQQQVTIDQDRRARGQWHERFTVGEQITSAHPGNVQADQAAISVAAQVRSSASERHAKAAYGLTVNGIAELVSDEKSTEGFRRHLEHEYSSIQTLAAVQQEWFDLVGLTGADAAADQRQAEAVIGRALSSAVNLVCSTTTGFGGAKNYRDLDYDTLIVDEASKVTVGEFLIPALRARRWILVGDEKQLTPFVDPVVEHHIHAMAAIHLHERGDSPDVGSAVELLGSLWTDLEDVESHPFRTRNVKAIARRLVEHDLWDVAHRQTYRDQLRHLPRDEPERRLLEAMRDHLVTSLFQRCAADIDPQNGPRTKLVEQRRMPSAIAELVRVPVYGGDYLSPRPRTRPCRSRC